MRMGEKLSLDERIARKQAQLTKLKSQQRNKERKNETRRLIYHGRLLEKFLATGVIGQQQYQQALDTMLVRNYDREFFGLPLNPNEPKRERKNKPQPVSRTTVEQPVGKASVAPTLPKATTAGKRLQEQGVSEDEFLT